MQDFGIQGFFSFKIHVAHLNTLMGYADRHGKIKKTTKFAKYILINIF